MLVLITLYALHRLPISEDQYFSLRLKWQGDLALLNEVTDQLIQEKVDIKSQRVVRQPGTGMCDVVLGIRRNHGEEDITIIDKLQNDERFDEVGLT